MPFQQTGPMVNPLNFSSASSPQKPTTAQSLFARKQESPPVPLQKEMLLKLYQQKMLTSSETPFPNIPSSSSSSRETVARGTSSADSAACWKSPSYRSMEENSPEFPLQHNFTPNAFPPEKPAVQLLQRQVPSPNQVRGAAKPGSKLWEPDSPPRIRILSRENSPGRQDDPYLGKFPGCPYGRGRGRLH